MRKILLFIIGFLLCTVNVYAKDSVYSINKYRDEEFQYILKSYDNKGYVAAGTFIKEEKEEDKEIYDNPQVMVVKYEQNGNLLWNYHYGKTGEDKVYGLFYSYDENHEKNGYIIVVQESSEKEEDAKNSLVLVILDNDGKLVKEVNFPHNGVVTDILEVYDDSKIVSGYLISGNHNNSAFLLECDLEFNERWMKDYSEYKSFKDIISYNGNYIVIGESDTYKLLQLDNNGNVISTIRDNFEKDDNPHLVSTPTHFILYGFTKEVKLNKKDDSSFYLIQYNEELKEDWETFGNTSVDTESLLQLQVICDLENCREYQLLYTNGEDSSIEIIRIGLDGVIHNKIKKLKNNYYHINSFVSEDNILYFIGQINCPEDDNCDYDTNSLFLVSNEDKVIEVKDNDSRNILFLLAFFFVIAVMLILKRKKKKK